MTDRVHVPFGSGDEHLFLPGTGPVEGTADHRVVLIDVAHDVDAAGVPRVREAVSRALAGPTPATVVCDLSEVEFLAVSGLRMFIELDEQARRRGMDLRLVVRRREPLRLIELTRSEHRLAVYRDRHTALVEPRSPV